MRSSEADSDPVVRDLRQQIADADAELLDAVNRRLELVRRLKEHKASRGLEFVDPTQEERLIARLTDQNPGPLSKDGLRTLYRALLDVVKREA
jgi:chorismate mutase